MQAADQVPEEQAGDHQGGEDEVVHDQSSGVQGEPDDGGQGAEVIADDDCISAGQREVRADPAHREAHVGGGECGRVVDPVPTSSTR